MPFRSPTFSLLLSPRPLGLCLGQLAVPPPSLDNLSVILAKSLSIFLLCNASCSFYRLSHVQCLTGDPGPDGTREHFAFPPIPPVPCPPPSFVSFAFVPFSLFCPSFHQFHLSFFIFCSKIFYIEINILVDAAKESSTLHESLKGDWGTQYTVYS